MKRIIIACGDTGTKDQRNGRGVTLNKSENPQDLYGFSKVVTLDSGQNKSSGIIAPVECRYWIPIVCDI